MNKLLTFTFIFLSSMHFSNASELIQLNQATFDELEAMQFESTDTGYAEFSSKDLEIFTSSDENFVVGIYQSRTGSEVIDSPYPYNEYMYILEGEIVTKTVEGHSHTYRQGESFIMPKGWMGDFSISKDLKIIYAVDGINQTENLDSNHIVKINDPRIFDYDLGEYEEYYPEQSNITARGITFFSNKAETFQIGLWESTEGSISGPATYHEFMYPLKGEIVLTNSNGERLVTKPGQGVIVPANWDGEFSVPQGVLKIWIIYQE